MQIFIKSFNRPYYLDRCINSILLQVSDAHLKIIVLDDGTHAKYLEKLEQKYPQITIKKSPFYVSKVEKIDNFLAGGRPVEALEIPTLFWLEEILDQDDPYFMLLEDDIWFTRPVNIESVQKIMQNEQMCMLKLFSFQNQRLISGELKSVSAEINIIKPKIYFENPVLFERVIIRNQYKSLSVLMRLGLYDPKDKINYYTIYNVAGAIFSKAYYEFLWKGFTGKVDEDAQLIKAVKYFNKYKLQVQYGLYKQDIISTSFSSSATNMFPGINLNVFRYNHLLNEAWYRGEFDAMKGYPGDIADAEISSVLENANAIDASVEEWRKWVASFKSQYRSVGHIIS